MDANMQRCNLPDNTSLFKNQKAWVHWHYP